MLMGRDPHVIVVLDTAFDRNFRRGILRYMKLHGPYGIEFSSESDLRARLDSPSASADFANTGIIGHIWGEALFARLASMEMPVSFISGAHRPYTEAMSRNRCSSCITDERTASRLAADFLAARKCYASYGFVGYIFRLDAGWSQLRMNYFKEALSKAERTCEVFTVGKQDTTFPAQMRRLTAWLKAIPKPAAVLVANDMCAVTLLERCRSLGINVPNEVSILGVDNDADLCQTLTPTLSSVDCGLDVAGYMAMEMLDDLLRGRRSTGEQKVCPCSGVVERGSTDISFGSNAHVSRAKAFIAQNVCNELSVQDVARHCGTSRSYLERKFRDVESQSVLHFIHKTKLDRVASLLVETSLPFGEIAMRCGFATFARLCILFKKHYGMTMREYRMRNPTRIQ